LLHGKRLLILEGLQGLDAELEAEATRLSMLKSKDAVERVAARLDVAPGILVGRMQKEGWLPFSHLN
jgi:hypothetical protein